MKSRFIGLFALTLILSSSISTVFGQVELGKDKVVVTFSVQQNNCEATIIANIAMAKTWHINSIILPEGSFGYPTSFTLEKDGSFKTVGGVIEPKPHVYMDEKADEMLSTHEGTIVMKRKIKINSDKDFTINGTFDFQTCDESKCLPPATYEFSLKVKGCAEEEVKLDDNIEKTFSQINGDEAQNKKGTAFVKVNNEWHEVPEGNSNAFYKKYLTLVSK